MIKKKRKGKSCADALKCFSDSFRIFHSGTLKHIRQGRGLAKHAIIEKKWKYFFYFFYFFEAETIKVIDWI
jgi:hypothetical protein